MGVVWTPVEGREDRGVRGPESGPLPARREDGGRDEAALPEAGD